MGRKIQTGGIDDDNTTSGSNERVKDNYFLPESVWDLGKDKHLCELINDNFNRDVDPNKALSELNPNVIYRCLMLYSNNKDTVLDPFLNRGSTPITSAYYNRIAYANEIAPLYVNQVLKQVVFLKNEGYDWANNIYISLGDARDIVDIVHNKFGLEYLDYVVTSPPYWDIEPYDSVDGQMADIPTYKEFLIEYEKVIKGIHEILPCGRFCTYIVNDFVRDKEWIDFTGDTKRIFKENGFSQQDIVINKIRSMFIIRSGLAFHNEHRCIKMHEYVLTFKRE